MLLSLVQSIINFFHKSEDAHPEEICPNCWGHQEYENKFRKIVKDQRIDVQNHTEFSSNTFIQKFVQDHIAGIHLHNDGDHTHCPKCGWKTE